MQERTTALPQRLRETTDSGAPTFRRERTESREDIDALLDEVDVILKEESESLLTFRQKGGE